MSEQLILAAFLALLIEGPHWVKLRWDFEQDAIARAWQLTLIIALITAIFIYTDGGMFKAVPLILSWLPLLLLPMQFVQAYGAKDSMPLNTFSFLAKHRRHRNLHLGLTEALVFINFGNAYFIAIILAAMVGSQANAYAWTFLSGTILLIGWLVFPISRSRPSSLVIALLLAGSIGLVGQIGIARAISWINDRMLSGGKSDPNSNPTLIGVPGPVTQSRELLWRLTVAKTSPAPKLLRTGTFNYYIAGTWKTVVPSGIDYRDLDTRLVGDAPYFLIPENLSSTAQLAALSDSLPRYRLRGSAMENTPLPVPGDAASIGEFPLDTAERNPLGSVRIFPKDAIIDGLVLWNGADPIERPPLRKEDLSIPSSEKKVLRAALEELQLDQQPSLPAKLETLKSWFRERFEYTMSPTIRSSTFSAQSPTAITQFLTTNRAGHCEYFASAAVLMLREAGIPARYAIGYSVLEPGSIRGEFLIRGTHSHAWCRVWDETSGKWLDLDTTPPGWSSTLTPGSPFQRLADWVKRLREDFFLWRNQPENQTFVLTLASIIGFCITSLILYKLWKSRRRTTTQPVLTTLSGPVPQTPLNSLETLAARLLGPRPPGLPLAAWLTQLQSILPAESPLAEAIDLHQRLRFDPTPPADIHTKERLQALTHHLRKTLLSSAEHPRHSVPFPAPSPKNFSKSSPAHPSSNQ